MGPEDLDLALRHLPQTARDERVLVGMETHDDAGVFRLNDHQALVQTVDFFTPVVDDPETFGRIAATNSLSDIWAMGATPLTALNLLAVSTEQLDPDAIGAMLKGGAEVLAKAGAALIGGHSIDDPEPKMGYAVTGLVHPDHIWLNATAKPGEALYLTKPVGTGVLIRAIKEGVADDAMIRAAVEMMTTLNGPAAEAIQTVGDPGACTDVTGFGLLGHVWEMAEGSGCRFVVEGEKVPLLPGALELARKDFFPGGSRKNLAYVAPHLTDIGGRDSLTALLADAVTAGGLLFTVKPEQTSAIESAFHHAGLPLARIGRVEPGPAQVVLA